MTLAETARTSDLAVRRARRDLEDAVSDAHRAGRSQRDIAADTGRSQPEVARLIARADRRRRNPTVADHALAIADELADGDEDFALRLVRRVAERLRAAEADEIGTLLRDRPETGDPRWDALLRGTVAWVCRERGLPAPSWSAATPLTTFWFVRPEPELLGRLIQETPHELAVLGIWLDANSLTGA